VNGADDFLNDVPSDHELRALAERAQRAFRWRAEVDDHTGAGSADGVTVTVNGSGALTTVRIEEAACAQGGRELATRILAALAAAQADVSAQLVTSAKATFGEESNEVATIGAALADRRAVTLAAADLDGEGAPNR
jgi:DNA-binding protein YbaB